MPRRAWQRKAWGHKASRRSPSERRASERKTSLRIPSAHRRRLHKALPRNRRPGQPLQRPQVHQPGPQPPSNRQRWPWSVRPSRRAWKQVWFFSWVRPPFCTSDTRDFPLHPVASARQAKPDRNTPGQRSEGLGKCVRDHADPGAPMIQFPLVLVRREGAIGYTGKNLFLSPKGGPRHFGRRPEGRRGPGRRGGGSSPTMPRLSQGRVKGRDAVRQPATRHGPRNRDQVRCGRCGSSSSR